MVVQAVCYECLGCGRENMVNLGHHPLISTRSSRLDDPATHEVKCKFCGRSLAIELFLKEKSEEELAAWGEPVTTVRWVANN